MFENLAPDLTKRFLQNFVLIKVNTTVFQNDKCYHMILHRLIPDLSYIFGSKLQENRICHVDTLNYKNNINTHTYGSLII